MDDLCIRKLGEQVPPQRLLVLDRERRRLILSERSTSTETRSSMKDRVISELEEGKVYTGKVTSLADFGAFVNIDGADGLVHLSEISWERIAHPNEILKVGQEVQVKVISVDRERKRRLEFARAVGDPRPEVLMTRRADLLRRTDREGVRAPPPPAWRWRSHSGRCRMSAVRARRSRPPRRRA